MKKLYSMLVAVAAMGSCAIAMSSCDGQKYRVDKPWVTLLPPVCNSSPTKVMLSKI